MAFSSAASPAAAPPDQSSTDDYNILLSQEHLQQVAKVRDELRRCETETEKYNLCVRIRDDLLRKHARIQLLADAYEDVMFSLCAPYRDWKRAKKKGSTKPAGSSGDNGAQWERFLGIAEVGRNIRSQLKTVAGSWGKDVVQHYRWASKGISYCNRLCAAARDVPEWKRAVTGLNLSMLERSRQEGSLKNRPIFSLNPIEPRDLAYLRKNPPGERQVVDVPEGFGFDKFGLLVHYQFATGSPNSSTPQDAERSHASTKLSTPASTSSADRQSAAASEELDRISLDPVVAEVVHSFLAERVDNAEATSDGQPCGGSAGHTATTALDLFPVRSGPNRADAASKLSDAPEEFDQTSPSTNVVASEDTYSRPAPEPSAPEESAQAASDTDAIAAEERPDHAAALLGRSLRSRPPLSYQRLASTGGGSKPKQGRPSVKAAEQLLKCCRGLPQHLQSALDRPSVFDCDTAKELSPFLGQLCQKHLKYYAEQTQAILMTHQYPLSKTVMHVDASPDASSFKSRRRASLSDIADHLSKRPRLHTSLPFSPAPIGTSIPAADRPIHDRVADGDYRRRALAELSQAMPVRDSHGERTIRLVRRLLEKAEQPNTDSGSGVVEAWFCTGGQAARLVESRSPVDAPIIAKNQQPFKWRESIRPIEQLFKRMCIHKQSVSVQIPSRKSTDESYAPCAIKEVRDRFCRQKQTDDPWNILDLRCPMPSVVPNFLTGENCQVLPDVRDMVLMGGSAERVTASTQEWKEWKNVIKWCLLSEGGHHTGPHMDSHGYATWITVQEGSIGFGWMSCQTEEEREAWMAQPSRYTGGRWRYIVLKPGETVFFGPGTIHFVFRVRGQQTFAVGGHVLQWSAIHRWVQVVLAELKNPEITNEAMEETAPKLVRAVGKLIKEDEAKIEDLSGKDAVEGFKQSANKLEIYHSRSYL